MTKQISNGGKKILFIEDESALQKTFSDLLSKAGYKMISALDGESGLRLAQEEQPDLILLDLILPRMHGFDVLENLKQNTEVKHIPIVVLTNLGEIKDVEKALSLGATTYLVKTDYKLEEVLERIKKILESSA